MKQEQIKSLYPGIGDGYQGRLGRDGKINPTAYHILEKRNYLLEGCAFEMDMMFFNPPFDSLTVVSFHFTGADFSTCREKTLADLTRRFGANPRKSNGAIGGAETGTVTYWQWFGPVTNVTYTEQNSTARHTFEFSISHTGAPGTYLE